MKPTHLFCAAVLFATASVAFAGVVTIEGFGMQNEARIISIDADQDRGAARGKVFIAFSQDAVGSPACVSPSLAFVFAVDPDTAAGRAAIELAQVALTQGLRVYASGTGQCTLNAGAEDLRHLHIFAPKSSPSERAKPTAVPHR
jgi:hypothetical protein